MSDHRSNAASSDGKAYAHCRFDRTQAATRKILSFAADRPKARAAALDLPLLWKDCPPISVVPALTAGTGFR